MLRLISGIDANVNQVNENQQPDLSVILINWRMGDDLRGVLPSIENHETFVNYEVILVNKPSEDNAEEIVANYPWVRYIQHDIFGIAEMRNVGIRAAKGRYCLMLDADTDVLEGCFDELINFMDKHNRVAAAGGHTRRLNGEIEHNVKRFYSLMTIIARRSFISRIWPNNHWDQRHLMLDKDISKPYCGDWVAGACFCMRRKAIEQIGLFDDRYRFGFEDLDWCWRAKRLGWKIAFVPTAKIIHKVQRKSARGINRLAFDHLASGLRFFVKKTKIQLGYPDDTKRLEEMPYKEGRSLSLDSGGPDLTSTNPKAS